MTGSTFARAIEEHLALKRRNAELDARMPLDRYRVDDPFQNHPLFKTEEQARLEETQDRIERGAETSMVLAWEDNERDDATEERAAAPDDGLWGRSRDFDWGD